MAGRNDKSRAKKFDSVFFWDTSRRFLDHELPKIRKKSRHTIASYRASLNICIGFLEEVKGIRRERVCFNDLDRQNLKDYLVWMADCSKDPVVICFGRMHGYHPALCLEPDGTWPGCPRR